MSLHSLNFKLFFGKETQAELKELSFHQLKVNVAIDDILTTDRGVVELYPDCHVRIPKEVIDNPNTPWGKPLGIDKDSVNEFGEIHVKPTYAINLENARLLSRDKLLIYRDDIIIKEYLGPDYHEMGMRWLLKEVAFGFLQVSRRKSISAEVVSYKTGIDLSTEPGDVNVYHWIARVLPKLKLVLQLPSNIPVIFSYPPNIFQKTCLEMFGVHNEIIVIDPNKQAAFENLILIEGPWAVGNPQQEQWLIAKAQEISEKYTSSAVRNNLGKKIFVYRAENARRRMINQREVKEYLERNDYTSYAIEDFSFADCVSLFGNADSIVFEHGASGIWLLFTKADVQIVELMPERNHISSAEISNYYFWLCCFLKRKFTYLASRNQKIDPWAEYIVDIKALAVEISG